MACENLLIPKPLTHQCQTTLFGIPYGTAGRTVAGQTFPISAIVLHCYDGTAAELCNEMKCRTRSSVISGSYENSFHYSIGAAPGSGGFQQHVEDNNISWTFGTYKNNTYATVPPPNIAINWPVLQGEHGINTTPDLYTIDIALAMGAITAASTQTGCYDCPTASGLQQTQHDMLIQMLAYLAQEYQIPIDSDHIQFHDLIHCGEGQECPCTDITTLLAEVAAFCPPCEQEAIVAPEAAPNDEIQFIYGITEPCCPTSPGCAVKIPWNGCFIGDMAVDGTLDSYILGLSQDPVTMQWCLTRGCLAVLDPIAGCGTVDDPLNLDLCKFGNWVPIESASNIVTVLGTDDDGCLIRSDWCEMTQACETPITVIDTSCINLTASGISNHTLQADIIISPDANNMVECRANGLFMEITCEDVMASYVPGIVETLTGFDIGGACVTEALDSMVAREVCSFEYQEVFNPTQVLTRDNVDCPVWTDVSNIITSGLQVVDTNTVDLTLTPGDPALLSAQVIIDPVADNILVANPAGLYVPPFIMSITGSDCIDVDRTGNDFTLDLVFSGPLLGTTNVVQCAPSGLFVPRGADAAVNGPLTGNGSDGNPLDIDFSTMSAQDLCDFGGVIPAGQLVDVLGRDAGGCLRRQTPADVVAAGLVVTDSPCIDLNLVGNNLSATPVLAPPQAQGANALICTAQGLYVPQITALNTSCIGMQLVNGVLTANPILAAPQNGVPNILNCITGQGLFVPEGGGLQVVDTTCINLTLTGAVLQADITLDPTGDNQAVCLPAGLYVPPAAGLQVVNTPCITLQLVNGDTLQSTPILAPTQGGVPNALTCLPDGLYVAQSTSLAVLDTNCIDLTLNGDILSANPIISALDCNGLTCEADGLYVNNDIQGFSDQVTVPSILVNTGIPGALPPAETEFGNQAMLSVTNPSDCNEFVVYRSVASSSLTFNDTCGIGPAVIRVSLQFSTVGPAGPWQTTETVGGTINPGETLGLTAQGFDAAFTQAVGQTNNLWVRTVVSNPDGNFCGSFVTGDKTITISGTNVIN